MSNVQQSAEQVLVVADDFTGANDAGVGLAQHGARVSVVFDVNKLHADLLGDAVVINTDSRAARDDVASQRTAEAVAAWQAAGGQGWIIKKIDSTLRGNLGAEIAAALSAAEVPVALIAAASPMLGRVTRKGEVWVNGRLLTDTEFASDPKTPVTSASIAARLAEQTALPVAEIHLDDVRQANLAHRLQQLADEGVRLIILDTDVQDDLEKIVDAASALPFRPLLVGSAGLSEALANTQDFTRKTAKPLLAIVGSMSDIAQKQITAAKLRSNVTLVEIDINALFSPHSSTVMASQCEEAVTALLNGHHCIIRTCHNENQRFEIDARCQQLGLSRQQLGETISHYLGELTRNLVQVLDSLTADGTHQRKLGGLYLSGGDIAIAVATALGATGFQIKGQIASCVPWGYLLNSVVGTTPVMTKAGGFGNETTLLDVLRFIEEKVSE
ncbi:D-threonate kinase [Pectobacterium aroidearum]|uniref:D-threonate kinase n=1 Tax=Pectobacterium aroidearum TaxID=1201031 RepID=UPI002114CF6C|nr:D-threonate kinase [Pectobacterium aroidearum]UUE45789.1 four-carbon acid sugar kinase family protein [Pectobacterium aroidearum]UUE50010.1 four-carbon acid sugar kinase family protein [Pectobacterium aroidearum]UUE54215.1 four-carbon acid sugar kinase family protein [Pectobacterium aroidearum]UUE62623.1 four-carbon acid sugar kinase family protein [Pectobacterium aroidearum]UUE66846.1 four-carbon acid sugar kinase family protein [Pectobacterium aroidearum]